jgi:hypothetical protein
MNPVRYVKFKNVSYRLTDGSKLSIEPIPYWDLSEYQNLIQMGFEKYIIKTDGIFEIENIDKETLKNFDKVLSDYLPALRRLT